MRRAALAACAAGVLTLLPAPAWAVSSDDIVQLAQAGLSDEVLIALIQTDNTVYPLDAGRILELRAAGVSEAVIIAMLRNGRPRGDARQTEQAGDAAPDAWREAPQPYPAAPLYDDYPAVEVPPAAEAPPAVERSVVAPPVLYVPYPVFAGRRGALKHVPETPYRGFGRFINDGSRRFINDGWVERGGTHRTSP